MTADKMDNEHIPCVIIEGGCYALDEKMGQTYVHYEQANTLAARDFKQPQMVMYKVETNEHF